MKMPPLPPMETDEDPIYVLQRSPYKENETKITIWVKEDRMKVSSVKLAQMLADLLEENKKGTNDKS